MKTHLRERIQLLSRQRDEKIKLLKARQQTETLKDEEIEAIELQLATQMNLESKQEVNNHHDPNTEGLKKELKRKLWTNPAHLTKTRDGATSQQQEDPSGLRPELVPGNGEQPQLRGERRVSLPGDPQPPGEDHVARHVHPPRLRPDAHLQSNPGSLPALDPRERAGKEKTPEKEKEVEDQPAPPITRIGTLIGGRPIPPAMETGPEELLELGGGRRLANHLQGTGTARTQLQAGRANSQPSTPAQQNPFSRGAATGPLQEKNAPPQHAPSAAIPPRCKSCGSTMREASPVPRAIFSRGPTGDTVGKCTVRIQRVPSLDAIAKRPHLPMPQHDLPVPANSDSHNDRMAARATQASPGGRTPRRASIRGKGMDPEHFQQCLAIIESSRRRRHKRAAASRSPAPAPVRRTPTPRGPGDGSDGTGTATRGHEDSSRSGSSDGEARDGTTRGTESDSIWPRMDPVKRAANMKRYTDDARRRYFMGIAKDEEQYFDLLRGAKIEREPESEHPRGRGWDTRSWVSDEDNLAEDINAIPSDTDSFVRIPEDSTNRRLL